MAKPTLEDEIEWVKARMIGHQDHMKVLDMVVKLHERIELLESQRIQHRAMIYAAVM